MRGLIGERLLKRFFGGILRQPELTPAHETESKSDNDEEMVTGSIDPELGETQVKRSSGNCEGANEVTNPVDSRD